MEKELLYWVFSTIVQAFVALLALVEIYKTSALERQRKKHHLKFQENTYMYNIISYKVVEAIITLKIR